VLSTSLARTTMVGFIPVARDGASQTDGAGAGGLLEVRKAATATAAAMTSFPCEETR